MVVKKEDRSVASRVGRWEKMKEWWMAAPSERWLVGVKATMKGIQTVARMVMWKAALLVELKDD